MITYQNENIGKSYSFRSRFHAPGYSVPSHMHEYSEILYVSDGCMSFCLDGEELEAAAGSVVFIFPNISHEYTAKTDCHTWCAVFSNDYLGSFFRFYPDRIPTSSVVVANDCISDTVKRLQEADKSDHILLTGLLHILFSELVKNTEFEERRTDGKALYNSAINYISANFRNDFTLADMARALGYHEKYLSSELHSLTKMNFRAFLSTYRIDHAKKLLRTSEENISEIALECGYSSINTFNRVFKESSGMTPSEYRKTK